MKELPKSAMEEQHEDELSAIAATTIATTTPTKRHETRLEISSSATGNQYKAISKQHNNIYTCYGGLGGPDGGCISQQVAGIIIEQH